MLGRQNDTVELFVGLKASGLLKTTFALVLNGSTLMSVEMPGGMTETGAPSRG